MNRRITADKMETEFAMLLLTVSIATSVNQDKFIRWLIANRDELQVEFCATDEPVDEFEIWARIKFRGSNGGAQC